MLPKGRGTESFEATFMTTFAKYLIPLMDDISLDWRVKCPHEETHISEIASRKSFFRIYPLEGDFCIPTEKTPIEIYLSCD